MNMTDKLKARFCKDFNIPIKVFAEPYFTSRLHSYDAYYHCVDKWNRFVKLVEQLGGEQSYYAYYNRVKDDAINYLNGNEQMMYFSRQEDMNRFAVTHKGFPGKDIYHHNNVGKCFVSFDMRRGNFTALHHYNPAIVDDKNTYEEFIGKFTDEPHLIESKYIRQVIFGNVNPRRQVTYEHYLMDKVLTDVLTYTDEKNVVYFSADEIVICIDENEIADKLDFIHETVRKAVQDNINIRSEIFRLHEIVGVEGYIKEILDGEDDFTLKCVDSLSMPFVMNALYHRPVQEDDSVFMYDKYLARLVTPLEVSIPTFSI